MIRDNSKSDGITLEAGSVPQHSAPGLLVPNEFRAALSRKLRTPLTDVIGFAELLATETETLSQSDHAQQILIAAQKLLEIIDTELSDSNEGGANEGAKSTSVADFEVLYIEDEPANVVLVQRTLERRPQLRMRHAGTGAAGLDLARNCLPRLILLDLHLPDIDGSEVLLRLQQDSETARIPVVVISADATASRIEGLLAAGARDYLTKPFDVKNFLGVVDQIIEEQSA